MPTSLMVRISEKFIGKINKNPSLIKEVERSTHSSLQIDEGNRIAFIQGKDQNSDVLKARDFVVALDNCVEESLALEILRKDSMVYVIDLRNIFSDKEEIKRVLARIIGEGGKIKARIAESTGCSITVNEPIIVLLGEYADVEYAKQAIQIIVDGSPYTRLFKYLEKVRREKQLKQFEEFSR